MPHEEQREKNIQLVTEKALDCFLENGIEKTKIADIARQCGLAERSVFRYFETKADLVLAASLLYWNRVLERIDQMFQEDSPESSTTSLEDAAKILVPAGFDIEIVEKHHNRKLDAPSGTALALADAINDGVLNSEYAYKYDRSQDHKKREKKEIGISAVRGGTIVGDHDVIFAGTDEVVTFSHTAYSRAIFGKGAIQAAKFLAGKPAGYYNMSDVIDAQA